MQLAPATSRGPRPQDVAQALSSAAATLGHRPAVTLLSERGREEQGVASLAQWAAKGAHLLEADLLLEPGDRLLLDTPLSWTSAAVCLAAWWAGVVVALDGAAEVAVVHESRTPPDGIEVLVVGDAIDGGPTTPSAHEPWSRAVQAFPDQPPTPRAGPDLVALTAGSDVQTQRALLDRAAVDAQGTLGVDAATIDPVDGLVAVALRPLVAGRPTVVLDGVDREVAAGERVRIWR